MQNRPGLVTTIQFHNSLTKTIKGVCMEKNIYLKWQQKFLGEFKTCATWMKIRDKGDFILYPFFQQICQLWHPFDFFQ